MECSLRMWHLYVASRLVWLVNDAVSFEEAIPCISEYGMDKTAQILLRTKQIHSSPSRALETHASKKAIKGLINVFTDKQTVVRKTRKI